MSTVEEIRKCSLITAIKTPYRLDGKFDLVAYDALVEIQIANGVEGLIIGGTTGEGHLMSWSEHIMLIAHTAAKYGTRIKVIGNTGSNNTSEATEASEQGFAVGMHCALQINPYYGKTSRQGLIHHFTKCLDLGPSILYNVPSRTGQVFPHPLIIVQDIVPDVVEELAKHPNFVGVKECMGNERIAAYAAKGIFCWSGNDDQAFECKHKSHGLGVISVTSNVVPGLMRQLMDKNDPAIDEHLKPLYAWMFSEPNPICLNTVLAMTGAVKPVFRLPYYPLNEQQQQQGIEVVSKIADKDWPYPRPKVIPAGAFVLTG